MAKELAIMKKLLFWILLLALSLGHGCGDGGKGTGVDDDTPPAAITDLKIVGTVDSTCVLTWTAPGDDEQDGRAASYDVRYATDIDVIVAWTGAYRATDTLVPGESGSTELYEVRGLSLDSNYFFGVVAADEMDNTGSLSNIAEEPVTSVPEIYLITPADGDSIAEILDITAIAVDDKGITKVEFFVNSYYIGVDVIPPYSIQWDGHSYAHGTTHSVHAQATDTDDNLSGSKIVYCYTDTTKFLPVSSDIIGISEVTDSSITIIWEMNTENDFQEYIIWYDTVAFNYDSATYLTQAIENQDDTTYTVVGLVDTSTYYFRVETVDNFDHENIGAINSAMTLNGAPKPVVLSIWEAEADHIGIGWSISPIHDFSHYTLYRSPDSSVTVDDLVLATIYEQDSAMYVDVTVDSGQVYYYAIMTEDQYGLSTISNVREAMAETQARYALQFDGSDYCVVPHFPELNFSTEYTIEAWVYPTSNRDYARIVDKIESQCCLQYSLLLHQGRTGTDMGVQETTGYIRANGNVGVPLNQWSHVAVTYNGGEICFYVDGQLDRCFTTGLTSLQPFTTDLNFGRRLMYDEFYFIGIIDEIRMWNYARTQTQLFDYKNILMTGAEPGLVGYWRFDEGLGDVSTGLVGNDCQLGSTAGNDSTDPTWVTSTAPISK
jgi:hypothetical protein